MYRVNLVGSFKVVDPVNLSTGLDGSPTLRALVAVPGGYDGKGPVADSEGPGGFEGFFNFAGYCYR